LHKFYFLALFPLLHSIPASHLPACFHSCSVLICSWSPSFISDIQYILLLCNHNWHCSSSLANIYFMPSALMYLFMALLQLLNSVYLLLPVM
jgi:hypothetical protein